MGEEAAAEASPGGVSPASPAGWLVSERGLWDAATASSRKSPWKLPQEVRLLLGLAAPAPVCVIR